MVDSKKVLEIIKAIGLGMEAEREYLTELGQPIGDSGHGANMAQGFTVVEGEPPDLEGEGIGTVLETVGVTLVSTVGNVSGPLHGLAYMKTGMVLVGKDEMDMDDSLSMMDTAMQAAEQRDKTIMGEAIILSAMVPSLKAMKDTAVEGKNAGEVLEAEVGTAWAGAEYTRDLIATKGRAGCMGGRGLGHQDPGTTSYPYMLEAIAGLV